MSSSYPSSLSWLVKHSENESMKTILEPPAIWLLGFWRTILSFLLNNYFMPLLQKHFEQHSDVASARPYTRSKHMVDERLSKKRKAEFNAYRHPPTHPDLVLMSNGPHLYLLISSRILFEKNNKLSEEIEKHEFFNELFVVTWCLMEQYVC